STPVANLTGIPFTVLIDFPGNRAGLSQQSVHFSVFFVSSCSNSPGRPLKPWFLIPILEQLDA
ncbi:MAG: hypothetical protein WD030_09265, partial [Pirellulales bacterium]